MSMISYLKEIDQSDSNLVETNFDELDNIVDKENGLGLLNIDQFWVLIVFLLLKDNSEYLKEMDNPTKLLTKAILGNKSVDPNYEKFPYGIRLIKSSEIQEIYSELEKVDLIETFDKADIKKINETKVFPAFSDWKGEEIEPAKEIFIQVVNFYKKVKENNNAILAYVI